MLEPGTTAPDFAIALDDGAVFRLSEQRGRPVALFFFLKAFTFG